MPNVALSIWHKESGGDWYQDSAGPTGADGKYTRTISFGPSPGPFICTVRAEDNSTVKGVREALDVVSATWDTFPTSVTPRSK